MSDTIRCPTCNSEIPLTEAITHQVEERLHAEFDAKYEEFVTERDGQLAAKDAEHEEALAKAREDAAAAAATHAAERVSVELNDLKNQAKEQEKLRRDAEQRELELRADKRKLETERESFEITMQRQLDKERAGIASQATERAEEKWKMQLGERDLQIEQMTRRIEDLQAAAEQKRPGLQGEVQERKLEDVLREQFPLDMVEPVKSGARGADILQHVRSNRGDCGSLLWESKRQKHWSDRWIDKLRTDQQAAQANIGIIVTAALPDGVEHLSYLGGDIWICDFASVGPLALMLRQQLDKVTQARIIETNRSEVAEEVYEFVCGREFQRYVTDAVISALRMKKQLDAERVSQERMFAQRETQIEAQLRSFAGLYGGLQGIAGGALQPVSALELPPGDGGDEPLALSS